MSNIIITDKPSIVQGPDDLTPQTVGTEGITFDEAVLLREYKRFLQKHDLREALYCQRCWGHNLQDGCEAHVTDNDILIKCRCTLRQHVGSSY